MNDEELQAKVDHLKRIITNLAARLKMYKEANQRLATRNQRLAAHNLTVCDLDDEVDHLKRIITNLGKRLKMYKEANQRLAAHNQALVTLMTDRGINANFMRKAKKAMDKIGRIHALYDETSDAEYGKALLDQIAEVLDGDPPTRKDNADFMWKAKRAMEKVERIREIIKSPHKDGYAGKVEDTEEILNDDA